jgi:hypothetical protein
VAMVSGHSVDGSDLRAIGDSFDSNAARARL